MVCCFYIGTGPRRYGLTFVRETFLEKTSNLDFMKKGLGGMNSSWYPVWTVWGSKSKILSSIIKPFTIRKWRKIGLNQNIQLDIFLIKNNDLSFSMGKLKEVQHFMKIHFYINFFFFINFRFCISLYHCNHQLDKKKKNWGTPPLKKLKYVHSYIVCTLYYESLGQP